MDKQQLYSECKLLLQRLRNKPEEKDSQMSQEKENHYEDQNVEGSTIKESGVYEASQRDLEGVEKSIVSFNMMLTEQKNLLVQQLQAQADIISAQMALKKEDSEVIHQLSYLSI